MLVLEEEEEEKELKTLREGGTAVKSLRENKKNRWKGKERNDTNSILCTLLCSLIHGFDGVIVPPGDYKDFSHVEPYPYDG